MPIFTKTYDFLAWLVPLTNHFPRLHRHTVTRRLLDAALDFQEDLLRANNLRGLGASKASTLLRPMPGSIPYGPICDWLFAGSG